MSKYTKYKLYQKYETRGSQEAIPCYPNVFSIDGDGTMPLVIVEENSRDCGYTGETQPIYRWYTLPIDTYYYCDACQDAQYKWVNLPIAEDWECVGTTKYYKQKKQVSVDGGSTWTDVTPPQYQRGALYEQNSSSCGYRTRTSSGSPYCEGYDKYVDVYSQYSTDGGNTWQTTATTPTLVEHNSAYCGYIEPQYRTTSGTPYCSGYDKYVDVYNQVSYDGGVTWETTATTQTLVERNSPDCGYVPPAYENQYFTLVSRGSGSIKKVRHGETFQYSMDEGSTWINATSATSISVNNGDRVMFKGTLTPNSNNGIGTFSGNTNYVAEGNPMSLLFGDNFIGQTSLSGKDYAFRNLLGDFGFKSDSFNLKSIDNLVLPATTLAYKCYQYMFYDCTSLTTIPSNFLPATTLADYCYSFMFDGCTSLTVLPELHATTLADYCYYGMFQRCHSLTTLPSLPTTTLTNYCYRNMFAWCTSLTTVPNDYLPLTTLADGCYSLMFDGCTSLTTTPVLSATTLADGCYEGMFQGCTSLATTPELPATTLVSWCYHSMFKGCASLNYIKCLATNISGSYCTTDWVNGVSSSGTFVKSSSMSGWTTGVDGIPSNWTVQNA